MSNRFSQLQGRVMSTAQFYELHHFRNSSSLVQSTSPAIPVDQKLINWSV